MPSAASTHRGPHIVFTRRRKTFEVEGCAELAAAADPAPTHARHATTKDPHGTSRVTLLVCAVLNPTRNSVVYLLVCVCVLIINRVFRSLCRTFSSGDTEARTHVEPEKKKHFKFVLHNCAAAAYTPAHPPPCDNQGPAQNESGALLLQWVGL